MAMDMDMGFLPTIKCSSCGNNVEIFAMGDHVCAPVSHAPIAPPSPPPSAGFDSPGRLTAAMAVKPSRSGAPPRIDPSIANRAFLQPNIPTPASSIGQAPSPLSVSAPRSPFQPSPREQVSPDDESVINLDSVFSFPMPGNRAPARISTPGLLGEAPSRSTATPSPRPGLGLDLVPENIQLPPSPLPPAPETDVSHQRGDSLASHSSYRTSLASTRYGSSTARSSTNSFSRGFRTFIDDTPPLPPAPLRTPKKSSFSQDLHLPIQSSNRSDRPGETYSGFDFDLPAGSTASHDLPEARSPMDLSKGSPDHGLNIPPQSHLHPAAAESAYDAPRKSSDASESAMSITSFARALGLDDYMPEAESSVSSDSSRSETRSGSSMSSLPSDVSLNRYKPNDPLNLGPLVEELPARTRQTILEVPGRMRSTMDDVPTIPAAFFSPDSPTDPAIHLGSLSLIAERRENQLPKSYSQESQEPQEPQAPCDLEEPKEPEPQAPLSPKPMQRSATAPIPRPSTRSTTRSKGQCRGCGEEITGKSISSSDGRLTGRYHRGCFVCFECSSPFPSADFYVLNNRPYCAQHYHERNGSLCSTCHCGIEGQYLETVERNQNRPERRRFHPDCLQCHTCHVLLKGDYFEWNGGVYCERDARRAAATYYPPSPGRRRPTIGSSPLAQSAGYPPPSGYPHPPQNQGLRPGPRFPPGGAGRFPERRTTKLMMF